MLGFDNAFASELFDPSENLIKAIFNRMEGKSLTTSVKDKIKSLINSNSIQNALSKVIEEESKNGNMVITTAEELKIYHAVKTILIHNKKIDSNRITYRDQKNSFNVLIDDNNKKIICKIISSKNKYFIELNDGSQKKYDFLGIESVVALKKQLLDITISFLD